MASKPKDCPRMLAREALEKKVRMISFAEISLY
jgi:hypothetical protein